METIVIRIDMPPTRAEVAGGSSALSDEQMKEEQEARQQFLDAVGPQLAALLERPARRAGNVHRVELLGGNTLSRLNHYLLLVSTDIGSPGIELKSLVPPGGEASEIGSYAPLQSWPEETSA